MAKRWLAVLVASLGAIWALPAAAGAITVALKPTGKGKKPLNARGKLAAKLSFSFTPTGGTGATITRKVVLKKTLP